MLGLRERRLQNRNLVARYQSCLSDQQRRSSGNNTGKLFHHFNLPNILSEFLHQKAVCLCIHRSIFACGSRAFASCNARWARSCAAVRMRCHDACAHRRDWWATSRYTEWRTIPCWRRTPPASAWSISSILFLAPKAGEKQLCLQLDLWSLGSRRPPPGWASNTVTANFQTATWRGWRRRGASPTWPGSPAEATSALRR